MGRVIFDPETCMAHRIPDASLSQVDFIETAHITIVCKNCGSADVVRYGVSGGGVQRYWCKRCQKKFVANNALPGMRYPPEQIASAMNMFYEGLSLNAVRRQLQHEHNVYPSDSTVYEWVVRFTRQAVEPLERLSLQTGDVWVVDETVLNIDGANVWFWDMIDDASRFLVASHLSRSRTMKDAVTVLTRGRRIADRAPRLILSDGLASYPDAVERVWGADTRHVRSMGFKEPINTNLIERFHGTLKQRTKVMRGMQNLETARLVMDGWLVHYNFFRPHESLKGQTPGVVARANYPWSSWGQVVAHGHIPTEQRVTSRLPT